MNSAINTSQTVQTILLVDDRAENLLALQAILEAPGRQLLQALSGNEALALALKHNISLILLDVQMPDMDGFEVAELLHRNPRTREIPVIFCTAINKEKKYISRGFDVGAVDYLFKPLDTDVLKAKVRAFLELDAQKRNLQQMAVDLLHARQRADIATSEAQAARDQLQSLLDCAPVMVIATDKEGIVQFSNTPPERPAFWPSVGSWWLAPAPAEQRPPLEAIFQDVLTTGISRSHETSGPAADGSFRFFLNHVGPMRRGTDIIGAVIASRDVTDQKRVQAELESGQRLATVGSLAAGVAHEINNPIGYVHSNLGTLQEYTSNLLILVAEYDRVLRNTTAEPAILQAIDGLRARHDIDYAIQDIPQLLNESLEGIGRVRKIVQDLKDFSHPAAGDAWAVTDLHTCIESTLNIVSSEVKYKATVEKSYGTIPSVECRVSELSQVFMNILVNAAQAIPKQGVIAIATGVQGDEVWVSITDNGPGITKNNLPHIFEPFFTTKPVGHGTGLGLSISYGIVKKHHGRIEVDTTPAGTTFRVTLPVRQLPDSAR